MSVHEKTSPAAAALPSLVISEEINKRTGEAGCFTL